MTIEFILFPVNTPPQITQDITLELLADSLIPEGQIQIEQHDECFFFFFFLKNEHAPGLTPHLRP